MKPEFIILIRHGESQGNVDKKIYETKPDYALELTEKGRSQARKVGEELKVLLDNRKVKFYISPYWRTRQTYLEVQKSFPHSSFYEDARLREQEWSGGLRINQKREDIEAARDSYGHFYYRLPNGESCADCYDRVSDFLGTLHRDFKKSDFPKVTMIVTHGLTMRLFLMRWFHYSVEKFELLANPENCATFILKKDASDKYKLITKPRIYPSYNHPYQFDWKTGKCLTPG